jgi:hypothetical protein
MAKLAIKLKGRVAAWKPVLQRSYPAPSLRFDAQKSPGSFPPGFSL